MSDNLFDEQEGVDFFTVDLIRRTRGRRERLQREIESDSPPVGRNMPKTEKENEIKITEHISLSSLTRTTSPTKLTSISNRVAQLSPKQIAAKMEVSPTKRSFEQTRARECSLDRPKVIEGHRTVVEVGIASSPQASPQKQSRAEPAATTASYNRRTPVKDASPLVKASPAKQFNTVRYDFQPKNIAHLTIRSPKKDATPQPLSLATAVMRSSSSTLASAAKSSSSVVNDIDTRPIVSVKSRVQAFHANSASNADQKPAACPERLPVSAKAALFEKAMKEESQRAAEVRSRDRFLQQRKMGIQVRGEIKREQSPAQEEEPREVRFKKQLSGIRTSAKFSTSPRDTSSNAEKSISPQSAGRRSESGNIASPPMSNLTASSSNSREYEMRKDERSAMEHFREIEAQPPIVDSNPNQEHDDDCFHAEPAQTGQNSLSGGSDASAVSEHSGRMYPELPVDQDEPGYYHSSPTKNARYDNLNMSPTKAPASEKDSTPMRTLSSYRLQQKQRVQAVEEIKPNIVYGQRNTKVDADIEDERLREQARHEVKEMRQEAKVQEEMTTQASKAIGLCLASAVGCKPHVDAEKTLLVSMRKRATLLNEAHKLSTNYRSRMHKEPVTGCLTIRRIEVPVCSEIILSYAKGQGHFANKSHHFFCLLSCGAQVVGTHVLDLRESFKSGFLNFDFVTPFVANRLRSDFQVQVEIYGIALPRENSKKDKKLALGGTPSKKKQVQAAQAAASHEGVVRNPNFKNYGAIILTQRNCHQKGLALQNFMTGTALQGTISFDLSMTAEYNANLKGFLNFFEERDQGVWVRRWTVLNGYRLSFWRFQEDELTKHPVGTIDLRNCISPEIQTLPYDVCARKNSFMILTADAKDKFVRVQYLLHKNYKTMISTRYVVAADLRDERDEWLGMLNQVVRNVRMWEENALQPCSESEVQKHLK